MQYTRGQNIKYNTLVTDGTVQTYTPSRSEGLLQMELICDTAFMISELGGTPAQTTNSFAAATPKILPISSGFNVIAPTGLLTVIEYY